MTNKKRKIELHQKLNEMGNALLKEGDESNDYTISQSGNILIILSNLILSNDDMYAFASFCSMFTAKKVLDSMDEKDVQTALQKFMDKRNKDNGK